MWFIFDDILASDKLQKFIFYLSKSQVQLLEKNRANSVRVQKDI